MKKLIIAVVVSVGLLGWQTSTAEASASNPSQNVEHHDVQHVQNYDFQSFQEWCDYIVKKFLTNGSVDVDRGEQGSGPVTEREEVETPEQEEVEVPQEEVETPAPQPTPEQPEQQEEENPSNELTVEEQQMLDSVNEERANNGLAPLQIDLELTEVARVKAQDMIDHNYFSHDSPTYGSPFDMMNQFGITYQTAGENLAGNSSVESAHTSLMNSDGHRENILSGNYTEVGIGIVDGGTYGKMFVQLFKG